MAALEVQNVKRAINRYGTLPKGARIGAYLESMRQSVGGAREPRDEARSLSPRTARAMPHMIRSNSSGGVTAPAPASPRAPRAALPLRSFADSPAKPRPRLAELEFPPPPPELPPPPEDVQPPPPPPDCSRDAGTDTSERLADLPPPPPPEREDDKPTKKNMKEMLELKLVAEIKERADKKKHRLNESPPDELVVGDVSAPFGDRDPVTRLVSELSESLNMRRPEQARHDDAKETVSPIDLKASLRKTPYGNNVDQKSMEIKNTDFKSQLKKVETNKKILSASKDSEESGRAIIDFKSRLRKVESTAPSTNGTGKKVERSPDEPRDDALDVSAADDDDKRRSTGSISSLKKLWESKESDERLSPAARARPDDESPEGARARRRDDKPAVPSKPPGKGKPPKQGIYATPLQPGADDADDADLLAALRTSLDWCTNEVTHVTLHHTINYLHQLRYAAKTKTILVQTSFSL